MKLRITKFLAQRGLCSRHEAERLVKAGRVKTDGVVAAESTFIETDSAKVEVDGVLVKSKPQGFIYLALNKPAGYITSTTDPHNRKMVYALIPGDQRLFTVGRLDKNTQGLLLLTNDGDFANRVMHPRYEVKKTYRVTGDRPLVDTDKALLEQGIIVEGKKTYPAKISNVKGLMFDLTIHEGRKHIVRNMMAVLGYDVIKLERIAIGPVLLGDLPSGKTRLLTQRERSSLVEEKESKK